MLKSENRRDLAELPDLLARAATGDVDAFMRFYDTTVGYAYAFELSRAGHRGARGPQVHAYAEEATRRRFVAAWKQATLHGSAGLSPLAWLLTLPLPTSAPVVLTHEEDEAACA